MPAVCFWHERDVHWGKEVNDRRNRRWDGIVRRSTGEPELEQWMNCLDAFSSRGRTRRKAHLPNVLRESTAIVERQRQADPLFRNSHRKDVAS